MIEMNETLSGGDYCVGESGILLDNSLQTVCYLALTGGNLKASTEPDEKPGGALYLDYWGNSTVFNNSLEQFNSEFERALTELPINSGNLVEIEGAAETDLEFLISEAYAESVSATASIVGPSRLRIDINIIQPSMTEPETISFVWLETAQKLELV